MEKLWKMIEHELINYLNSALPSQNVRVAIGKSPVLTILILEKLDNNGGTVGVQGKLGPLPWPSTALLASWKITNCVTVSLVHKIQSPTGRA